MFPADQRSISGPFVRLKGYLPKNVQTVDSSNCSFDLVSGSSDPRSTPEIDLFFNPSASSNMSLLSRLYNFFISNPSENFPETSDPLIYLNLTASSQSSHSDIYSAINQQINLLRNLPPQKLQPEIVTCAEFYQEGSLFTIALPCKNDLNWFKTYLDKKFRQAITGPEGQFSGQNPNLFLSSLAVNLQQHKNLLNDNQKENQMVFDSQLFTPHVSIIPNYAPDSGIISGILQGQYRYMHYRKDDNDNHWGCAYRSLQTLASWFSFNSRPDIQNPPTFYQIQSALVQTGDKDKSFIKSRKWIGSFEVATVLNQLYEIESKIIHVTNGEEMQNQARFLINHFQNGGAPIMIGGGVLAHTIIGCSLDTTSGECEFLILDPHYLGGDEGCLDKILKEGWVGWKKLDFWRKDCFYNMCVPES